MYAAGDVLVYSRGDGFERMIIMLNKASSDQNVSIDLPEWLVGYTLSSLDGQEIELNEEIVKIGLKPYSFKIFNIN